MPSSAKFRTHSRPPSSGVDWHPSGAMPIEVDLKFLIAVEIVSPSKRDPAFSGVSFLCRYRRMWPSTAHRVPLCRQTYNSDLYTMRNRPASPQVLVNRIRNRRFRRGVQAFAVYSVLSEGLSVPGSRPPAAEGRPVTPVLFGPKVWGVVRRHVTGLLLEDRVGDPQLVGPGGLGQLHPKATPLADGRGDVDLLAVERLMALVGQEMGGDFRPAYGCAHDTEPAQALHCRRYQDIGSPPKTTANAQYGTPNLRKNNGPSTSPRRAVK